MTTASAMRRLTGLLPLLALVACGPGDDFARPGTWQPTGANEANLQAMVARPADLTRGTGAATDRAPPAVMAVRRLERDMRKPLPDTRAAYRVGAPVVNTPALGESANGR